MVPAWYKQDYATIYIQNCIDSPINCPQLRFIHDFHPSHCQYNWSLIGKFMIASTLTVIFNRALKMQLFIKRQRSIQPHDSLPNGLADGSIWSPNDPNLIVPKNVMGPIITPISYLWWVQNIVHLKALQPLEWLRILHDSAIIKYLYLQYICRWL